MTSWHDRERKATFSNSSILQGTSFLRTSADAWIATSSSSSDFASPLLVHSSSLAASFSSSTSDSEVPSSPVSSFSSSVSTSDAHSLPISWWIRKEQVTTHYSYYIHKSPNPIIPSCRNTMLKLKERYSLVRKQTTREQHRITDKCKFGGPGIISNITAQVIRERTGSTILQRRSLHSILRWEQGCCCPIPTREPVDHEQVLVQCARDRVQSLQITTRNSHQITSTRKKYKIRSSA